MTGLFVASNTQALGSQLQLQRNTSALSETLTRLSTGLRINSGKDDPAGLIASELLKSDITATKQAIQNTQRANSMIAVADSALGQISSLLNDIRSLVNASANTGALSHDQIEANQLQIDASIDSIDRISKTTNFQGMNLLDGSLGFSTSNVDSKALTDLNIYSANFGTQDVMDVQIDVKALGEKAALYYNKAGISEEVFMEVGGAYGKQSFRLAAGSSVEDIAKQVNMYTDSTGVRAVVGNDATHGQILITSAGSNNDINLVAKDAGFAAGNYAVKFTAGTSDGPVAVITDPVGDNTGVIDIQLQMEPWKAASGVVDESQLGVYSNDFATGGAANTTDVLNITTTNGTIINSLKFIPSSNGTSGNAVTSVALDLDKNGVLNIEYDSTAATWEDLINAINRMEGVSAGMFDEDGLAITAGLNTAITAGNAATNVASGGTIAGIGTKSNNAIEITSTINGTSMNDTDVVYVKNDIDSDTDNVTVLTQADSASITLGTATNSLKVTANNTGSAWNGITINYVCANSTASGAKASYDAEKRILTVNANGGATTAEEIQNAIAATGLFTAAVTGDISDAAGNTLTGQLGGVNGATTAAGIDMIAGTVGGDAGDVVIQNSDNVVSTVYDAVTYASKAQLASVTIEDFGLHGDDPTDPTVLSAYFVTFSATETSTAYNDLNIRIENNATDSKYSGTVIATYNAESKELHIIGDLANATYSQLISAVNTATDGKIQVAVGQNSNGTGSVTTGSTKIGLGLVSGGGTTGTDNFRMGMSNHYDSFHTTDDSATAASSKVVASTVGTNHPAIIVNAMYDSNPTPADNMSTTANDVIYAINNDSSKVATAANFHDSDGSGTIFGANDKDVVRSFISALTGGSDGNVSSMTAQELIDFINSDERLSALFSAELAAGNDGTGLVTLFQEFAWYGDTNDETALQFLGPQGSPNIDFVIDKNYYSDGTMVNVANSELYITWENDPVSLPSATLTATSANAAFSIESLVSGSQYDDVAVQFIRLDATTYAEKGNYAVYESGPSQSTAYCSISEAGNGTAEEVGKFILTANAKGDTFDNVSIKAQVNSQQAEAAIVSFDATSKTLMITLSDATVSLSEAMAAIEAEGTFTADFDYSFNTDIHGDVGNTTFEALFGESPVDMNSKTIGNTGVTGSHSGGVLKVYLGGETITAADAIKAINESDSTKGLFNAKSYLGSDGSGVINFRNDTLKAQSDDCNDVTDFRMVTSITDNGCNPAGEPTMVVHLATDQYGNSITTARDLVEFFESLTAEQTRGISVSMIRPTGINNVEDAICDDDYGKGILQETGWYDDCDNYFSNSIKFESANQSEEPAFASGQIVAVNGESASYTLRALVSGTQYEGVSIKYNNIGYPSDEQESVSYDPDNKILTLNIREGMTTAYMIKQMIESDPVTKALFAVDLADGSGGGLVTSNDNALSLTGGTKTVGTAGGAYLLDNYDASAHSLTFESVVAGSKNTVTVNVIEGTFDVKNANGTSTDTAYGTDAVISVNGQKAIADGNDVSLNNTMLSLEFTLSDRVQEGDQINFTITGGGATFQLGPDVVSNQQIRISIPNVSASTLGGASGKLYQLRSGESADMFTNTKLADRIVQEAISSIAITRGRLGAIQRSTLEPNQAVLEDTVEQLSSAEAIISNADFAEESSKLTRQQILMQSASQALSIANQLPQYAAQLVG